MRVARLQREAEGRKIGLRLRQIAHGEGNVIEPANDVLRGRAKGGEARQEKRDGQPMEAPAGIPLPTRLHGRPFHAHARVAACQGRCPLREPSQGRFPR